MPGHSVRRTAFTEAWYSLVLEHTKSCVIIRVTVAWKAIISLLNIFLMQPTFWNRKERNRNNCIVMRAPDSVVWIANG